MSYATPSFSSAAAMPLMKAAWASGESRVTVGSTTFRQTEVLERNTGSRAKKSIHGVFATQSTMVLALPSARACSAFNPPTDFAQSSASR